jgi:hypothetical protein
MKSILLRKYTQTQLDQMPLATLRRKQNQAWEMSGLARVDRDTKDEKRWRDEALAFADLIKEMQQ